MVKLLLDLLLFSGVFTVTSPSYEEDDDPFPGDFLTPYRENGLRSQRSKRSQTKGCEPVPQGNSSYEKYTSPSNNYFTKTHDFIRTNNFLYEMNDFGQRKFVYGHISVADNPLRTFSVLEPDRPGGCKATIRSTVAATSKQRNCLAAINAGFFRTSNGQCLGNVVSNKRLVQDSGGVQNANFGIRKDGTIVVGYLSQETVLDKNNPFVQLVSGVVWLLRNRNIYVDESKKAECRNTQETGSMDLFANVVSARTAIGHDSRGRIVLVQVDGKTHRRGINLYDFAKLLKKFDVVNAINLDGGGSSTFVINSTTVNYPSDECGDYICSRKVSTIACIHKPDCIPADCNKHGKCHMGECICDRQLMGAECDKPLCKINNCSSNGVCTEDGCICFSGWKGDNCQQACQGGFYGINCSKPCLCQNRGSCSHKDGSCKCQPGWIGPYCEQACPHGRYGLGCSQTCNCSRQFCYCNKETGHCLNNTNQIDDHESQKFLTCLLSKNVDVSHPSKDNVVLDLSKNNTETNKDYRQLFVWFIGAISLCGVSLLANMVLIFLQCNRATRPGRSRQRPRLEETAFLFSPDEEEL